MLARDEQSDCYYSVALIFNSCWWFGFRNEEKEKFIHLQDKNVEVYTSKKEALLKRKNKMIGELEEEMKRLQRLHWEKMMAVEKQFDEELDQLMEEHTPSKSN